MRSKLKVFALIALVLIFKTDCAQGIDGENENVTTTEPLKDDKSESSTMSSENLILEMRNIDSDYQITTSTTTTTHKIPPTLLNTKVDFGLDKFDVPGKTLKDFVKPTAPFHSKNIGQSIDAKVKKAVINSKQQAFKNLNSFVVNNEIKSPPASQDQVAKPAENQDDISKETPKPNVKEFLPSPELSPLYTRDNEVRDHFNPMNQYFRPGHQDARFPNETPFNANPILDTRWLGGNRPLYDNRPPNESIRPPPPIEFMRPPQFPHGRNTNTNIDNLYHYQQHRHHHPHHHEERITFPNEENSNSNEVKNWPGPSQVPALHFKQPHLYNSEQKTNLFSSENFPPKTRGTWKWIPEEDSSSEPEINTSHSPPLLYETYPQPPRDRPYSFEAPSGGFFSNLFTSKHHHPPETSYQRAPSGPGTWPSSGSDTLVVTEEYAKHEDHGKGGHNEGKHLRPSPWKKIIHVMTAAIPIGLIISALTPRVVYVHPNASVPTFQPPLLPPNQQPFQPPAPGQVNGPFPIPSQLRHRSQHPVNPIDASLTHFLRTMEMQFRHKQQQEGGKVDGACEDLFFCEVALLGRQPNADAIHRMLYNVALETPDIDAKKSGLGEIFAAIKRQDCDAFDCKNPT